MTNISELIEELQEFMEKHGDLEVFVNIPGSEEKIGWPKLGRSIDIKDESFKTFELEKGCRCLSCFEWFDINDDDNPTNNDFLLIQGDY